MGLDKLLQGLDFFTYLFDLGVDASLNPAAVAKGQEYFEVTPGRFAPTIEVMRVTSGKWQQD